jgi:uncharacterized protein YraI
MKILRSIYLFTCAIIATPFIVNAQELAYTSKYANLRAGPSRDFPLVAVLPAGTSLTIVGCIQGYLWCDVVSGSTRGWLYSGNIVHAYQGKNAPVITYGAILGLGITTFNVGNYWDNYYSTYPWYPQRQYWINRPEVWTGIVRHPPRAQVAPVRPLVPRLPPAQVAPVNPRP